MSYSPFYRWGNECLRRGPARPQTQVVLSLKPVLLNQRTRSALGLLPLFSLKMWLFKSFPGPKKGIVLSTGQREGSEAHWLCGVPQAHPRSDSDVCY